MKKTIELTIFSKELVKREVEFPIYMKDDMMPDNGESVYYHRIDKNMNRVTIHYNLHWDSGETSFELKVTPKFNFGVDGEDYSLGKGNYACTAEEFNRALTDAIAFAELMRRS